MIKIVGIAGSPRPGKSTHLALKTCLDVIRAEYADAEPVLLELAGRNIQGCIACGACNKQLTCSQNDDFQELWPVLADSAVAGLIIAAPVYFGTMSSQTKAFLDRCVMLRRNGMLLRNKVGGVIAVGGFRNGGQETTIQAVQAAMLIQDMIVVGDGHNTSHYGGAVWSGHPDGFAQDTVGLETVRNLGRRVAGLALKLRGTI